MPQDPYSLDLLQDIVEPSRISWWPPAPGWLFLAAILAIWAVNSALRALRRYRARAYRRQALRELEQLVQGDFLALSEILKRVALLSFSRERVACLTGVRWLAFLEDTCEDVTFPSATRACLASASSITQPPTFEPSDWRLACTVATKWIVRHREESTP